MELTFVHVCKTIQIEKMAEQIRTFIAVELDENHHRALCELQTRLKGELATAKTAGSPTARDVRWVAPDNIHLTLKFLGGVESGRLPDLQRAVADVCASIAPFALSITGAGAFPNTRRPNVIWVGVGGDVERATALAQKIDDACAALGFAREERPFSPHLTLGRVKRDVRPSDRQFIGEMIVNAHVGALGELRVERVSVMKSELHPGGSVYTRLAEIRLTNDK
jgi:RNA 2',3'-cyclic 3'-phosphodiesterase